MKQKKCNWTGGYKWSTALALSITLGGFGADRLVFGFYVAFEHFIITKISYNILHSNK